MLEEMKKREDDGRRPSVKSDLTKTEQRAKECIKEVKDLLKATDEYEEQDEEAKGNLLTKQS